MELKYLASIDRFHPLDMFKVMKCFENDLGYIHKIESTKNVKNALLKGFGIPVSNTHSLGPCLLYWIHPYDLINENIDSISRHVFQESYSAKISVESSSETMYFPPTETTQLVSTKKSHSSDVIINGIEGKKLYEWKRDQSWTITCNATFILELSPSILLCDSGIQKLIDNGINITIPKSSNSISELLIQTKNNSIVEFDSGECIRFSNPSCFDSSLVSRIFKIPFNSYSDIKTILNIVRFQICFNEMILSCFNPDSIDSTVTDCGILVEFVSIKEYFIGFCVLNGSKIEKVLVKGDLNSFEWNVEVQNSGKNGYFTSVLRATWSLPVLVASLLSKKGGSSA